MTARSGSRRWFHFAVLTAAMVAVLFVASGAALWHHDASGSEANCPVCHVAHMPILPGMSAGAFVAPTVLARTVLPGEEFSQAAPVSPDSPPRAPPV